MTNREDSIKLAPEAETIPPKPFPSMSDEQWARTVKGLRQTLENWDPSKMITLEEASEKLGIKPEDVAVK